MNLLSRSLTRLRLRRLLPKIGLWAGAVGCLGLASCSSTPSLTREMRVSVADQKLALYENGAPVKVYNVSTSKFGLGDSPASNCTPVGKMRVARKIGYGLPPGMVFKSRRPTGEILRPNAPGRDPVVTRIMWLQGTESKTRNAYSRFIYIHGTPEERNIGKPASYGCIRMRSMDVIDLFNHVPEGMTVQVDKGRLPPDARRKPEFVYTPPPAPVAPLKQQQQPGAVKAAGETQLAAAGTVPGKRRRS